MFVHAHRYSEPHLAETYPQQGQRIAPRGQKCALRERANLETLAELLRLRFPILLGSRHIPPALTPLFTPLYSAHSAFRASFHVTASNQKSLIRKRTRILGHHRIP
jgi:hypothetical protein